MKEFRMKLFYCVHYSLLVLSLAVGAIKTENRNESIFLINASIGTAIFTIKNWILTWRQKEILNLLNRVCVFSIRNDVDHKRFDKRIRGFMTSVLVFFITSAVAGSLATVVLSVLGSEKKLFLKIGFPLDYQNSETAFWIAALFLFTGNFLYSIAVISTAIIWYLLFVCALRYEVVGSEFKDLGISNNVVDGKQADKQMHKKYLEALKNSIDVHLRLRGSVPL